MTEFFEEKRKTTGSCATARKPRVREIEWLGVIQGLAVLTCPIGVCSELGFEDDAAHKRGKVSRHQ